MASEAATRTHAAAIGLQSGRQRNGRRRLHQRGHGSLGDRDDGSTRGQARGGPDGRVDPRFRGGLDGRFHREHSGARRGRDTATNQANLQALAALLQPALERADGEAELPRRLLVGQALEVAEDDRRPEPLGEPVELGVDVRTGLRRHLGFDRVRLHLGPPLLDGPPAGRPEPRPGRDLERDPEEPARHRVGPSDRAGPLRQDQERRLRRVLGVVEVWQRVAADAQDHRPVALDQLGERRRRVLVATTGQEPLQQPAVGQHADRPGAHDRAQVPRRRPSMLARHHHVALAPRVRLGARQVHLW